MSGEIGAVRRNVFARLWVFRVHWSESEIFTEVRGLSKTVRLFSLLGVGALCVLASGSAFAAAPTVASSPCDPDYYETLEARAWLEAEREVTQNQNLISKPDSVLRYSCFNKMMDSYASNSSSMFSGGADVSVPKGAANDWVTNNFSDVHPKAIGGRSGETSGLSSSCDGMAKIWQDAQCMDFADKASNDAFFSLADYVSGSDKRFDASCTKPSGWSANNDALKPANTAWEEDNITAFFDEFDSAGGSCESSIVIQTGVQAIPSSGGDPYDAKVCVRLGCVYDYAENKCVSISP